ncbi:MAG: NAD(P)-dependent oxidoreductase [Rhodobacteraceae bacterium]|nr:NAD(P)-dependent oxidoreductase [Paracoccaceae bacterium]
MTAIAFIGLGVMGYPMAGHLARSGHSVTVFNRTRSKSEKWVREHGGNLADSPAEAAHSVEIVMACVDNDHGLRMVCTGEAGAFAGMSGGNVFVDHTTVSAAVTREMRDEAARRHIGYVDAPVSGGQAGAENGVLSIMCGGDAETYARVEDVLGAYSRICKRIGDCGAGQLAKMVNQICIAGLLQGLSEGLHFADRAGLDGAAVVEVIAHGAAGSWQMENRFQTMLNGQFDFGFAVDLMRKDLGICLDTAEENGASLPVTALVDQFYKDVQNIGGARWDTSSLIQRLRVLDGGS